MSECDTKGTNHASICIFEYELLLFVKFEADSDCTLVDECDFSELIQFVYQGVVLWVLAGFQIVENGMHELPVLLVGPGVVVYFDNATVFDFHLWGEQAHASIIENSKELHELKQEVGEEEAAVNWVLYLFWKLTE